MDANVSMKPLDWTMIRARYRDLEPSTSSPDRVAGDLDDLGELSESQLTRRDAPDLSQSSRRTYRSSPPSWIARSTPSIGSPDELDDVSDCRPFRHRFLAASRVPARATTIQVVPAAAYDIKSR